MGQSQDRAWIAALTGFILTFAGVATLAYSYYANHGGPDDPGWVFFIIGIIFIVVAITILPENPTK